VLQSIPTAYRRIVLLLAAAVFGLVLAAPAYAQTTNPGLDMITELTTGVLALLAAGAAIVIAVALFFAAKAFVNRVRS